MLAMEMVRHTNDKQGCWQCKTFITLTINRDAGDGEAGAQAASVLPCIRGNFPVLHSLIIPSARMLSKALAR